MRVQNVSPNFGKAKVANKQQNNLPKKDAVSFKGQLVPRVDDKGETKYGYKPYYWEEAKVGDSVPSLSWLFFEDNYHREVPDRCHNISVKDSNVSIDEILPSMGREDSLRHKANHIESYAERHHQKGHYGWKYIKRVDNMSFWERTEEIFKHKYNRHREALDANDYITHGNKLLKKAAELRKMI